MGRTHNEKQSSEDDSTAYLSRNDVILVSRYLDGDLNRGQVKQFEKRLEDNAALRKEVSALRAMQAVVKQTVTVVDANAARERVFTRLERAARQETARAQRSWHWISGGRGGAFAAGLAAATIASFVFLMPGQEVVPDEPVVPTAMQAASNGPQVPLPEVGEIEALSRLHDAQPAESPEGGVTEGAL